MTTAPAEIEFTELSEFDEPSIPCEIPSFTDAAACAKDPQPAEWIGYRSIICSCGVLIRLCCTACKEQYQRLMALRAFISCPKCGEETKGFDRFEPLVRVS